MKIFILLVYCCNSKWSLFFCIENTASKRNGIILQKRKQKWMKFEYFPQTASKRTICTSDRHFQLTKITLGLILYNNRARSNWCHDNRTRLARAPIYSSFADREKRPTPHFIPINANRKQKNRRKKLESGFPTTETNVPHICTHSRTSYTFQT